MEREALSKRRATLICLIRELGGDTASLKDVAREAIRRGLYSPKTAMCDIEDTLGRMWRKRERVNGTASVTL